MTAILGKDASGKSITIEKKERREGLYIIGSSGTGKSTLLTSLIQSDIEENIGLCLLDPHGDLIQRTIELMPPEKYKDVILLEIANPTYAFGVNLFHCKDINDMDAVENVISQVMHLLDKVYSISSLTPMMNQYFLNLTQTLLYNPPSSFLDIPRLLGDTVEDKKYRTKLSVNVPNTQTRRFWATFSENRHHWRTIESIAAIENKLDDFFRPVLKTIFGQEITTINMREIIDDPAGKILLIKMNARWESITKLVGSVIVGQILDAAYSRSDIPTKKRKHFSLYADEFQWFASQDFSTLFSEARKYGIGLTIAHQTLEQVDPHIIATCKQAKTIISFRVSGDNAASLSTQFDSTPPEPKMEESGRRKKQTSVANVVEWLRSARGGHPNPIVNQFTAKYLLDKVYPTQEETLANAGADKRTRENFNTDLYYVMMSKRVNHKYIQETHTLWVYCIGYLGLLDGFYRIEENKDELDVILQEVQNTADAILMKMWHAKTDSDLYKEAEDLRQAMYVYLARCTHDWFEVLYEIEILPTLLNLASDKNLTPHPNNESQFHKQRMEAAIPQLLLPRRDPNDYFTTEFHRLEKRYLELCEEVKPENVYSEIKHQKICEFVRLFRGTLEALAQTPILADSGEEEVIYRPGSQQTHADKQAEIANMLTRLPNMHAYARVASEEHTITVEQSNRGMKRQVLAEVIADITEHNLYDGYIRLRSEVEKEIEERQNPPDEPPSAPQPAQSKPKTPPQSPGGSAMQPPAAVPTPRTRIIGTPVTKQCSACGTQNAITAKFCNDCGTKLPEK